MEQVSAIVVAAGRGLRLKSKTPKPLVKINSIPVIIYSLCVLSRHPYIKNIILVVNPENKKDLVNKIRQYRIGKITKIVDGGKRRQDSVLKGLKTVDNTTRFVLIHDCARPVIDKRIVSAVIKEAKRCKAAILGVPVKSTIKELWALGFGLQDRFVKKTLDREKLWEIQTPQVFKKDLILQAYRKFGRVKVSDDASLVEKLGVKVSVVEGSHSNIKITTPEDLVIAQAILKKSKILCLPAGKGSKKLKPKVKIQK